MDNSEHRTPNLYYTGFAVYSCLVITEIQLNTQFRSLMIIIVSQSAFSQVHRWRGHNKPTRNILARIVGCVLRTHGTY